MPGREGKAPQEPLQQADLQQGEFRKFDTQAISSRLHQWAHCDDPEMAADILHSLAGMADASDVIKILAQDFYNDQERIADRLTGSWLAPTLSARNRTVGVYYQRLRSGGAERVMALLTQVWKEAGFAVVVFTDEPPHADDYTISPDIPRIVLPALFDANPDVVQGRLMALRDDILKHKIGIFVHNSVYADGFLFDVLTIKACGVPVVAVNHGTFATSLVMQSTQLMLATKTFALLDSLVVLARRDEHFWRVFDVPARYVPNPLQWNIHDIKVGTLHGKNILWVGRLSFEKRIFDALEIFAEVVKSVPDAKLLVVGKGEKAEDLIAVRNKIAELNIADRVELCGYTLDIAPFYQKTAVYLMTSQLESFSMTLMESKAHGVPCVLFDLPNLELLRVGRGAVVVRQRDLPAAARAVVRLLRDEGYRKEMGLAARDSMEAFLATVDIAKEWIQLFNSLGRPAVGKVDHDPRMESFRNNVETLFNCIRAGIEWRDEWFVPKADVAAFIRKTTRKGLAGWLVRLLDSARKRLSHRPRKAALAWDRQLRRHARYSRRLLAVLGVYAVLATIALLRN